MYKLVLPPGDKILHVLPQEFTVDDEQGIIDPIGMSGIKLEANFHVITGQISASKNILRCIEKVHLDVADMTLEPIASADAGSTPLMIDSRGTGAASGDAPTAGLAASIEETDSSEHLEDTITAGGESVNEEAASRICSKAVSTLAELEKWGLVLRRTDAGLPHASMAPGHTKPRMTGCGDSTLREVTRILEEQAIKRAIPRRTDIVPISLVMDNQQVRGIVSLDLMSGNIVSIQAKAVILATEGHQGMWSDPSQGSGSGAALAAQAGVGLAGMAHTPRHALTMSGTGLKLPFDLLGSGGRLRRGDGEDVGPEGRHHTHARLLR